MTSRDVLDEMAAEFIRVRAARPSWIPVEDLRRPASIAEGYEVQKRVHDAQAAAGDPLLGYKVGATSRSGQQSFGIDEPVYAGIFASGQAGSLAEAVRRPLLAPSLECEIAVRLRSDLDGSKPILPKELVEAIGACHIACEIVDNRYGDPLAIGVPALLADDFFHAGFVLGPERADWHALDLKNLDAAIEIDNGLTTGSSADVLDALSSLHWLARKLAMVGRKLLAGQIILTGTIVPPTRFMPSVSAVSLRIAGFEPLAR